MSANREEAAGAAHGPETARGATGPEAARGATGAEAARGATGAEAARGPTEPTGLGTARGPTGLGTARQGAGSSGAGGARRRGPQPRHTRQEVVRAAVAIADAEGLASVTIRAVAGRLGTGVMSLYSYVPDKQTLVYEMVEEVSGELDLPEPSGDWRADMHKLAGLQRTVLHRHPWMIEATSHLQPLGPAILATLEFALAALEPTGLTAGARLETFALVNGFVAGLVRAELATRAAAVSEPARAAAQAAQLQELLATGRYPRFAAAVAQGGPPATELGAQFERLLDRILDGLVAGTST